VRAETQTLRGTSIVVLALGLILTACGGASPGRTLAQGPGAPDAVRLPDVLVSTLDGTAVSLPSLAAGTPLLINYWYAACPPCKEEMPALAALAREFSGRVTFIGINPQDDAETAQRVAAERGTTYRQLLDSTQRSVDALGLTGFPTTVLVSRFGTIVATFRKSFTEAELRDLINRALLS